jgi:hypothetical protein
MEQLLLFLSGYLNQEGDSLKKLCDFIGISKESIRDWTKSDSKPKGMNLIKLRYYLEHQGYKITELEKMPRETYELGWLIAFGKIDLKQTAERLGYGGNMTDELVRLVRIGRLPVKRMETIGAILLENKESLADLKKPEKLSGDLNKEREESVSAISDAELNETVVFLQILENLSKILTPRLKRILENGTPEMRRRFRETFGSKHVFDLSNAVYHIHENISMLCSEKSREMKKQSL